MSQLSLTVIVVLCIVVVILLIAIISILNKKDDSKKVHIESEKDSSTITIDTLELPRNIEKMSSSELQSIARKIYNSYKCFDYKNMDGYTLAKKEWHTWQVSILLMIYKKRDEFFIPNQKDIFADTLLNSELDSIEGLMKDILVKYNNYVDVYSGKDKLSKEYLWSNSDVSLIFYFLTNYKNF